MFKRLFILLFCLIYFKGVDSKAQNKYAIIIGINEYYSAPGVLSNHSLKGCVNDALSMSSLLADKFSFSKQNTTMLLNANATQKNTISALMNTLEKAKAGDAVVFYFCGHGIYIENPANLGDPIKGGYNQSICMSDLYAKDYSFMIKDNTLKKIFNQFVDKKILLTTIFDCCFSGSLVMSMQSSFHNPYCDQTNPDAKEGGKSILFETLDTVGRAFNIEKVLTLTDTSKIPRPSEIKNSKFASISAATQYQIAQEIYDESDIRHGVFTKAILNVYENRKTDVLLPEILKLITKELANQNYDQTPTYRVEDSRLTKNLIGLPLKPVLPLLTTTCLHVDNSTATFDVGTNNNVNVGNVFTNKDKTISITIETVYPNRAEAKLKAGIKLKAGDILFLKDGYKVSKPLIKIYISTLSYTWAQYYAIFNSSLSPFINASSYRHYYNWDAGQGDHIYQFKNEADAKAKLPSLAKQPYFYIFSGIPYDMASAIKRVMEKDQNIQLVDSEDKASYILYLNPIPTGGNSNFVITYRPKITNEKNDRTFCIYKTDVNFNKLTHALLNKLVKNVTLTAHHIIRKKTTHWLNTDAKK